ncbi:carboxypeptidase-like regulatory domain-containing protein [Pedobacter petrophilus]|uniref:carboxypeptidase-like regulatory domain-containing protein n=1 Tax=Pedobacter petrophilus TaxID=1908241 RepID=UPI00142EF7BD|nr:carboxypeptidase-like regulatory domain-containing protein [Pedobacter petrophilus]
MQVILKAIERQTSYVFFSDKSEVDAVRLSVNFKNIPLKEVLNTVLTKKGFQYRFFDKTIAIKKYSGSAGASQGLTTVAARFIYGQVVDENNLTLKNIAVQDQQTEQRTTTNNNGTFKLSRLGEYGTLIFSGDGFSKQTVDYTDSTALRITMKRGKDRVLELSEVSINATNSPITIPNRFVDLSNRGYMNLAQILQGTVPGLTLQTATSTSKVVTSLDVYVKFLNGQNYMNFLRMSVDEFLTYKGNVEGQQIIDLLLSGRNVPKNISNIYILNTVTKSTTVLIPQVRGANSFAGSTAGMLVVIDGFPQDGFPANFPMSNVESIEVVKDPRELVKWGTRANNGLILIKTKVAQKGHLQINYSANFYYEKAPRFNREKMQLASTADYLDYVKDIDTTFKPSYSNQSYYFTPAQRLFAQNRLGMITPESYSKSLDSLSGLSNEGQLSLLQQDRFSQNHSLNLNGGNRIYKFNFLTNYLYDQPHDLGSYSKTLTLNLNNTFNLFHNNLKINWLINYSNALRRTGYSFQPNSFTEPYQLLHDPQGNYEYDYSGNFSPYANALIMANGYRNYGVNVLEDARSNKNLSRFIQKRTSFNLNWSILPGLTFGTSIYYDGSNLNTNNVYGKQSSYVRQLVDTYGEYTPNGVNYYVPWGDILQSSRRNNELWNLRSGITYSKSIGKHQIALSVGGGASSTSSTRPNNSVLYGYNAETNYSSPVFLPTPDPNAPITNYNYLLSNSLAPGAYPATLTRPINGDTSVNRNLNANAVIAYKFADRLTVSATYNSVLSPVYGQAASYSTLSSSNVSVNGLVIRHLSKFFNHVYLSTGIDHFKLPDLPESYSNIRYQQSVWNNYAIWVNGLQPTQQKGQSSTNWYQKLTFNVIDSLLTLNVAYNTLTNRGNLNNLSTDPASLSTTGNQTNVVNYVSAGLSGILRHGLLKFQAAYAKSPEGIATVNGGLNYDIGHEKYFTSDLITAFDVGAKLENISAYQGLGIIMGTNVGNNGSFSQAVNNNYTLLPPNNVNLEVYTRIAIKDDLYSLDLRYYNRKTSGLNNFTTTLTDPTTGTNAKITYSTITNKGLETYFRVRALKTENWEYGVTLNGAYNLNIVTNVPDPVFYGSSDYTTMYRNGYDVSSIFSVKSAGLDHNGDPQIYSDQGKIVTKIDSSTITTGLIYSGKTRAPWTGGLIHDVRYKFLFARVSLVFNLGHVMRTYIPYASNNLKENSVLIANRWRKPGDEEFTNVPRIDKDNPSNLSYRAFVTQNGTNSITTADNIRLQEVMIGCNLTPGFLKKIGVSGCTITLTGQNLASWSRNPYHIDPATVDVGGRIGLPIPTQYSFNINVSY